MSGVFAGQRILVVEDEVMIAEYLADALEQEGAQVVIAVRLQDALKRVEEHVTAAIIDPRLREGETAEVCHKLQCARHSLHCLHRLSRCRAGLCGWFGHSQASIGEQLTPNSRAYSDFLSPQAPSRIGSRGSVGSCGSMPVTRGSTFSAFNKRLVRLRSPLSAVIIMAVSPTFAASRTVSMLVQASVISWSMAGLLMHRSPWLA